jgi:ferredoxin
MAMPVKDCIVQLKKVTDEDGKVEHVVINDFESYDALAVDQDRCIRCDACRDSCPVDCISLHVATPKTRVIK